MEEYYSWMIENAHLLWWAAGAVLLASEMLLPGVFLLWIGIAAAITGVFAWLFPDMGFEGHGMIFAVLGAALIYVGKHYFYANTGPEPDAKVNIRGQQHVGKVYIVAEPIKDGRGHVSVADSRWLAEGPDTAVGDKVRVISVEGTILKVESVTD